ncbi:hypothetical protein TNCV_723511 [Trichonephila clavipes]|nr:hypothetical protein TNCV_723511 [Trichonephila clavipes]
MSKTDQDAAEEYAARLEDVSLQAQHLLFATSVHLRHWDTLNSLQAASLLTRWWKEKRGGMHLTTSGCSPSKLG